MLTTLKVPAAIDDLPPRFLLSLHKCGSTMVNGILESILRAADIPFVNFPREFFQNGVPDAEWQANPRLEKRIRKGVCYTGYRLLPDNLKSRIATDSLSVLVVRDPRDALVSAFFSFGPKGSHVLPSKNAAAAESILKARQSEEGIDIDAWVLKHAPGVLRRFTEYTEIIGKPFVKVFQYETILFAKKEFALAALSHFKYRVHLPLVERLVARQNIIPVEEDATKHIRKAIPGDHKEKLRPETIAVLSDQFRDVMAKFGYVIE